MQEMNGKKIQRFVSVPQTDVTYPETVILGVLQDGVAAVCQNPRVLPGGFYEDAPVSGLWYPKKKVGDCVEKGEELGQIRDVFGQLLFSYVAKEDGVLLYQTVSLGIEKNRPMIAYGIMDH